MTEPASVVTPAQSDAWQWWESRRLVYNLALGAAGLAAYGLHLALRYAFGWAVWSDWHDALSTTLSMGTSFLVVMFIANVFYLLGMLTEGWTKPTDRNAFRKHIFALGLWGSVALPFILPLGTLAQLFASPGGRWD